MPYARLTPDNQWAGEQVAAFPVSWADKLLKRWNDTRRKYGRTAGNLAHLHACKSIATAQRAGLSSDANDAQLCQEADESARDMKRRLGIVERQGRDVLAGADDPERLILLACLLDARAWMDQRGLLYLMPERKGASVAGVLNRLCCARWWRRILRRVHARAVESVARSIGLVHKRAGCYVSDDSLRRRTGQIVRNERALESVAAVNEHAQAYTLAELAAKGSSNREIRRHELMTRIAGFELIARDCGHDAYFLTVTCPSAMHAWRTKRAGWGVEENPHYDGHTTPDEAQRYLTKQWSLFRAAADRAGLDIYGFRIAEPNHDGTPHWHALLFFPQVACRSSIPKRSEGARAVVRANDGDTARRPARRVLVRLLRRYFFARDDYADQAARKSARAHRIKVERIDWNRGSAAGYVAKYVAKNIDGYRVEKDLYGNEAIESSRRVDAWAATWRVRQFQQIGGAPVTTWRELRRMHPGQDAAGGAAALALDAINAASLEREVHTEEAKRYTAATAWASFVDLQGGYKARRSSLRFRALKASTNEQGRYGDEVAPRSIGIEIHDARREWVPVLAGGCFVTRKLTTEIETERSTFIVVPGALVDLAKVPQGRAAFALQARELGARREALRTWSPVNNCTQLEPGTLNETVSRFAPLVERHKKLGRFHHWKKRPREVAKGE